MLWSLLWLACVRSPSPAPEPLPHAAAPTPAAVEEPPPPERSTGCRTDVTPTTSAGGLVVSAHPEATRIGAELLRAGGGATDAAIGMAVALTLVEPQSSGLGGGAFLLHYDASTQEIQAWDGRETAPREATPELFMGEDGPRPWPAVVPGGLSVGVPGLVRLMERVHQAHGRLPWADLWQPTTELAETGFRVSPRMSRSIAFIGTTPMDTLSFHEPARQYFLPEGKPLEAGSLLRNPELAETTRRIGQEGADALYTGELAQRIVQAVGSAFPNPGSLGLEDLAGYEPVQREPLCAPYGEHQLCGHPPPTSGGSTVLQILGILEPLPHTTPGDATELHHFAEATRLAWADRALLLGDPAAVGVPLQAMLAPDYLERRSERIGDTRQPEVEPGDLPVPSHSQASLCPEGEDTTHLVAVDARGNVVSMTSSIEMAFGSGLFVGGFLLNNQLTDFALDPRDEAGQLRANAPAACKRPRSSMAPMIVLDEQGEVELALGSPGGSRIISYVARVLHEVLEHEMPLQQAISRPNVVGHGPAIELEEGCGEPAWTAADAAALEALGHPVKRRDLNSGLHGIQRVEQGWQSGVDPRREGEAMAVPPPSDN